MLDALAFMAARRAVAAQFPDPRDPACTRGPLDTSPGALRIALARGLRGLAVRLEAGRHSPIVR